MVFCGCILDSEAQEKTYKIHTIAFYNLENLFDTINDPLKLDEISPIMELKIDKSAVFQKKIKNMARAISEIGFEETHNTPVILGVSEIENRAVLEALVTDSSLIKTNYGIIHYDSPDVRGIDVGLLYQKQFFTPLSSTTFELKLYDDDSQERIYTRDQLLVSGLLEGEYMHIIVNHWPSRRGGEAKSRPSRMAAAKLNKHIIDSLHSIDPYSKIITMGDLNDDPINSSLKTILKTEKNKHRVSLKGIYNPFENFYKNGMGTTAYRDAWSLFDQILVTQPFVEKNAASFHFYKAGIFNKNFLITDRGPYKGYPFRSFSDGGFTGGYSDHFPVYMYIIKEIKK